MPALPSPRLHKRPRLEIIPFIDIMFFLLATFMMVSLSMIKNEGVPVKLPTAATGSLQERNRAVSVTVKSNGDIFYNKDIVSIGQLEERLRTLKISESDPRVFINGDAKSSFDAIVTVLDEVRKSGISKVAIETTGRKKG